ncbi:Flp pilus assembly protein TadG [Sphingomonas gellani]|uniref:Flp pilus assembly protein TadG n=2 Tax=Sphingomonas gellani TaxID=1166340 RepID=A0A1H8EXR1_9SPHN|nr:Flp pilus assembly protein TadG [Sphingomonas gellani]
MSRFLGRICTSDSGVALIEFAIVLPVFVTLSLGGAELANYATTRMRISQLALQIADNAARIGTGSPLVAKTISESDINDLFVGSQLASNGLDLKTNGRVILSDLEPMANPNTSGKFKIVWQRCYGTKIHSSSYGVAGATDLSGIGPASRQVTALDDNATMFVEVYYRYKPLISTRWTPAADMVEIASMSVRDRRDLSSDAGSGSSATHPDGVYKVAGVTPSTC